MICSLLVSSDEACEDTGKHCKYWKDQGFCTGSHVRYMTQYCPKTCNKC